MTRVKRGTTKNKRRTNILAQTKGYRGARKSKLAQAREAIFHAGSHAFAHRRDKKHVFRASWNNTINYALRSLDTTYSKFIHTLSEKNIGLNRKVLASIAKDSPESFERIVNQVK